MNSSSAIYIKYSRNYYLNYIIRKQPNKSSYNKFNRYWSGLNDKAVIA